MSNAALALAIASMALPDAAESQGLTVDVAIAADGDSHRSQAAGQGGDAWQGRRDLWLRPGWRAELLVTVHNRSDRPVGWRMAVGGDFPMEGEPLSRTNWCEWQPEPLAELQPQQTVRRSLGFLVPGDFFEQSDALQQAPQLRLNYQGRVSIYMEGSGPTVDDERLVDEQSFALLVRPASAYLNFLPNFYREVDFAGRLLSMFEQGFDPAVQATDALWAYLDPLTAPEALLPFLAHWVAWPLDPRWKIGQQRRLIRHAMTLYRWHGTRWGLRLYLHLYTGLPLDPHLPEAEKHIAIEETHCQGLVLDDAPLGQGAILGGGRPYHFQVRLRSEQPEQINETLVRELIERQKPAFCTYDLEIAAVG
ncbi:MAG: phage tail protein, partial [Synechococcales bacterium]|nr:phage tail protein [Synechococcales bacterium]